MTILNLALFSLLLPAALAVPRNHNRGYEHHKHHHPSGGFPSGAAPYTTGGPASGGAPYGGTNSTVDGPTATGNSVIFSTVTVSPVPVSSGQAPVGGSSTDSPVGASGSTACGPATVTVTTANTVTVTVGANSGSDSSAAGISAPATVSRIAPLPPFGNGTSSVAPIGTGGAASSGLPVYSGLPVTSSEGSSLSIKPAPYTAQPSSSAAPVVATTYPASVVVASSAAPVAASSSSSAAAALYVASSSAAPIVSSVAAPVVSSVAVPSYSASSSTASASASVKPDTSSVKARGLVYNSASLTNLFSSSAVGWAYNWGQTQGGSILSNIEYVPMLHDNKPDTLSAWTKHAQDFINSGGSYLLGFNEPDMDAAHGGSEMSVQSAIDGHNSYMKPLKDANSAVMIGSPAVTSIDNTEGKGLSFLSEFLKQCSVDFITIHWYGTTFEQFSTHVKNAQAMAGGKPIWITEFQVTDGSDTVFLAQALPWLDNQSGIARYAYQSVDSSLVTGSSMTPVGQAYNA